MIGWVEQSPIGLSWRSHDNDRVDHAAIIHVAVADVDAAYGSYAAAENNTFNKTNNRNNTANNNANNNAKHDANDNARNSAKKRSAKNLRAAAVAPVFPKNHKKLALGPIWRLDSNAGVQTVHYSCFKSILHRTLKRL